MKSPFDKDELLLAWIAGFFDGEGCVIVELSNMLGCIRGKRTSLHATLTQTSTECLELVKERFGGNVKVSDVRKENTRRWAVQYTWVVRNENALKFFEAILPYAVVKKSQIELALQYPLFNEHGKKFGRVDNPIPDNVWEKRLQIRTGLQEIRQSMKTAATVLEAA
jgi:intein/homing endonuclease